MNGNPYFGPGLFEFLEDLKKNNNREWFQQHKIRYESELLEPLVRFIEDFSVPLRTLSPYFVADPKRVGGSLFRIYRDVRFSADKSPYKTAAGIHFRHAAGKNVHCPGYYLHLEPGDIFVGLGIWRPDSKTLLKIRNGICESPELWISAKDEPGFSREFSLGGESLKRAPKGFDADHPLVEDLKRKDFVAFRALGREELFAGDFVERFSSICRAGEPLMRFLTMTLKLPF